LSSFSIPEWGTDKIIARRTALELRDGDAVNLGFGISAIVNGFSSVMTGFINLDYQLYALLMGAVYYIELVNWFYAVKHIDVSVASSITTPNPVITMILAIFFLQEMIQIYQIIAMIIVFLSLYGLLYFGRRKTVKNKKS